MNKQNRMKFLNTMITCFLVACCLQHVNAQTINNEDAFNSYMQQKGKDENFTVPLGADNGHRWDLSWYVDSKGDVVGLHGNPFYNGYMDTKDNIGNIYYRGFIPNVGSFIQTSEGKNTFYLFRNGQATKISELPCFRQNDNGRSESLQPPVNPLHPTSNSSQSKYDNSPKALEDDDKTFTAVQFGPCFAGNYADWKHFLHCCLDQSVLVKDHVSGQKFQVTLLFIVGKDGMPYDIKATDVPSACPDCGSAAIKLLYKHVANNALNNCDVKTSEKPYKQWLPAIQNGRNVLYEIGVIIPFGYEDDPQNKKIVNHLLNRPKIDPSPTTQSSGVAPPSISTDNDTTTVVDDEPTANVVEQNGKYILTLLKDNSKHIVFRPQPKNMDTVALRKWNTAIGINQGGWGEIIKDKNGKEAVMFYTFTSAGTNEVLIQPIDVAVFKAMFYEPK